MQQPRWLRPRPYARAALRPRNARRAHLTQVHLMPSYRLARHVAAYQPHRHALLQMQKWYPLIALLTYLTMTGVS
jgi:hypothetical protein